MAWHEDNWDGRKEAKEARGHLRSGRKASLRDTCEYCGYSLAMCIALWCPEDSSKKSGS
jgi:hypothetical protein